MRTGGQLSVAADQLRVAQLDLAAGGQEDAEHDRVTVAGHPRGDLMPRPVAGVRDRGDVVIGVGEHGPFGHRPRDGMPSLTRRNSPARPGVSAWTRNSPRNTTVEPRKSLAKTSWP